MKNTRKLSVEIKALPGRSKRINPDEYEKIFGGKCSGINEICKPIECKECCDGFGCVGEAIFVYGICRPLEF